MKAPEKIYIFENPASNESDDIWLSSRNFKKDIEYIRKDAFIEKACKWLNKELPITDLSSSNMLDITFNVFDKETKKGIY